MFGQLLVAGIRYLLDGAGSRVRYRIFDYFLIQRDAPAPRWTWVPMRDCAKSTRELDCVVHADDHFNVRGRGGDICPGISFAHLEIQANHGL